MEKPQVLLLTHGGWGMGLVESTKMIIGAVDFVHEIPLTPEVTFSEYYLEVKNYVEKVPSNSIILTDLFGGTTTNVGAKVGKEKNVKVISGLNAPLLIEACSQIKFTGEIDFNSVLEMGQQSVKDVVSEIMKSLEGKATNNG
ncbi:PTS sugar transporter subunit IIA [Anaerocolumna aminovalerica]|uniref:PTS sugar transporter subunit IIA n=1 Tax=Anaerocolumna aminovalerica TaxID=1527 RepID=UPI0015966ED3|nr:PTS sugar transporter subunit IIA [Anaerocolumna aminovalerica]